MRVTLKNRVLIVEDNPDAQEVMVHLAESLNLTVDRADDGEAALGHLQMYGEAYVAAVIDLALPGRMDGVGLIQHIRAQDKWRGIHCIAMTAFHTSKLRIYVLSKGFDTYYAKPVDQMAFIAQLRALASA
jgi:DNA-binding response OmpR family regulator